MPRWLLLSKLSITIYICFITIFLYYISAMTAKDYPSLWGFGTTKTFKIPVEHLDFKYIEKCSDVKHLEKILCVLR